MATLIMAKLQIVILLITSRAKKNSDEMQNSQLTNMWRNKRSDRLIK